MSGWTETLIDLLSFHHHPVPSSNNPLSILSTSHYLLPWLVGSPWSMRPLALFHTKPFNPKCRKREGMTYIETTLTFGLPLLHAHLASPSREWVHIGEPAREKQSWGQRKQNTIKCFAYLSPAMPGPNTSDLQLMYDFIHPLFHFHLATLWKRYLDQKMGVLQCSVMYFKIFMYGFPLTIPLHEFSSCRPPMGASALGFTP